MRTLFLVAVLALPALAVAESEHDAIRRAARERAQARDDAGSEAAESLRLIVDLVFELFGQPAAIDEGSGADAVFAEPEARVWLGAGQALARTRETTASLGGEMLLAPWVLLAGEIVAYAEPLPGTGRVDLLGLAAARAGIGYADRRGGLMALFGVRANWAAGVDWTLGEVGAQGWWSLSRRWRLAAEALLLGGDLGPDGDLQSSIAWTPPWGDVRLGWRAVSFAGRWLQGPEVALVARLGR